MKPVHVLLFAGLTAAVLAAPVTSADAHRRHRGHSAVPAFALGLMTGAIVGQGLRSQYYDPAPQPHYHHGHAYGHAPACAGLAPGEYDACISRRYYRPAPVYRAPVYQVVPRHSYRRTYHRHIDPYYPGPGVEIIIGR